MAKVEKTENKDQKVVKSEKKSSQKHIFKKEKS